MGNHTVKFDIISNLPPELTLVIISRLNINDVTHCLLVCRSWYSVISTLGPYWIGAAVEHAEIPLHTAMKYNQFFSSPLEFFISVKQHRKRLESSKFSCSRVNVLDSNSKNTSLHCLFSNSDSVVTIQYLNVANGNHRKELVVSNVCTEHEEGGSKKILRTLTHFSVPLSSVVTWAYIAHSNQFLYTATRGGVWSAFDLSTCEELFQWQNDILRDGIGVTFGCCKKCMTVVMAHWSSVLKHNNSSTTTCSLQIVKLGGADSPREVLHWKAITISHAHSITVSHDSRYWLRDVLVVPESDADEGCGSHQILLQCDTSIVSQRLSTMPEGELSTPRCLNCHFGLASAVEDHMIRKVSSTLVLSADRELLGAVMNRELCMWRRGGTGKSNSMGLQLINVAKLSQQHMGVACIVRIITLGHALSIVGYVSGDDYRVQIVSVQTGGVLVEYCSSETFQYQNKLPPCQVDPFSKHYFTCKHDSDWLDCAAPARGNNWNQVVADSEITIAHNRHGSTHMEVLAVSVPKQEMTIES